MNEDTIAHRVHSRLSELTDRVREHESLVRALQAGEVDATVVLEKHGTSISHLQSDERLYRTIVDALPQSVATVLVDGTIVYLNHHLASMIGIGCETLLGNDITNWVAARDRDRFLGLLERALDAPQEEAMEFRWDSGSAPAAVYAMRLPIPGIDVVALVIVDIRDQVARYAAEEASRAKDDLIASVSHELRTPLTSIMGWVQLIESQLQGDPTLEEAIHHLKHAVTAEVKIVDDLLDLSRFEGEAPSLDMRPVDLSEVLRVAIGFVELQAKYKEIRMTVEIAEDLVVHGDADRLRQIFLNLLSNAVKFTTEGDVSVRASREGGSVVVRVTDSGIGISREFLPQIFEPFRRDDGVKGHAGLGVGLAISRRLVEAHGGTIEAMSDGRGHGATFTVRLPL